VLVGFLPELFGPADESLLVLCHALQPDLQPGDLLQTGRDGRRKIASE
jgi:hypothetical protein